MEYTRQHLEQLEEMIKEYENKDIKNKEEHSPLSLAEILDHMTDFICVLDEKGKVVFVNLIWRQKLGYSMECLREKDIFDFIHPQDTLKTKKDIEEYIYSKQGVKGSINRVYLKDGSYRWITWDGGIIYINNKKFKVGIGRDITREKENENRRLELQKVLEREKYKNMFFSTISHEFKTPLNIILSIIQLFKVRWNEENEEEQKIGRYIEIISRNAYKTLKIANNLIDLIKMDTITESTKYNYYNIVEVAEEITMEVARFVEERDISILFDTEIEEKVVWCDDGAIERILLNLLSNAIKYSPLGGEIWVQLKEYKDCVSISVKDQGPGMIQDGQLGRDTQQIIWSNGNTGLGLKLVNQIITLYGGKLLIYSNEGTEIVFTVPTKEEDQEKIYTYREGLMGVHKEKCNIELCDI